MNTTEHTTMNQFEVGKTYQTRSICDHDCIIAMTVTERTKANGGGRQQ